MISPSEKANCIGWYFESKSIVKVQRNFHTKFNKPPPSRNSILSWHKKFLETGSVLDKPRSGRPSTSDSDVERIREAFTRSPTKSTRQASIELGVARSSIRDVLHKRPPVKDFSPTRQGLFAHPVFSIIHAQSGLQEHTKYTHSDIPNLDAVKKESIEHVEEILPSASNDFIAVQSLSNFTLPLKSEPNDDCVDGMKVLVHPDNIVESSFTSYTCADNEELPSERPNISQNPFTNNAGTKDEFQVFGDFVAAKLRSLTDRHLQVEAQHCITNMLLEMEMEDLNRDRQ